MKSKCDKCDKPATVHLTEIAEGGKKVEKHLCADCAMTEGITIKANMPLSQLLEEFVMQSGGGRELPEITCDVCGMTFADFRNHGLLGCPHDYEAFESALGPLIERSQESAGQHVGKVPRRAGSDQKRHNAVLRLRAQLRQAIAQEDYEAAAELRDRIKEMEQP